METIEDRAHRLGFKVGDILRALSDMTTVKAGDRVQILYPFEEMGSATVLLVINQGAGELFELDVRHPITGNPTWLTGKSRFKTIEVA